MFCSQFPVSGRGLTGWMDGEGQGGAMSSQGLRRWGK